MNKIPIVFAFDNNLILPACVCISSLMMHANKDTYYDIFILHARNEKLLTENLEHVQKSYTNCRISYIPIDGVFDHAFEIRGITTPAYYRLLIPEVILEYEKVIYSDVDVIFRMDLSNLYQQDLEGYYLAATRDLGLNLSNDGLKYIQTLQGVTPGDYLQSGLIVLNNDLLRRDGVVEKFKVLAKRKLKFQDQDILNIVCHGRVKYISLEYNMTDYSFYHLLNDPDSISHLFEKSSIQFALTNGNIHYNGHKPWKKYSVNFDIWWEYYRKSPVFDNEFYFNFYYHKLNELDQLSLWKRIKILLRYFFVK